MAETPAPHLFGAQRVIIACDASTSLSPSERRSICEQLVKKAQAMTSLPVAVASEQDLDPVHGDRKRQATQLLLRVASSVRDVSQGRKSLSLLITPVRQRGGVMAPPVEATATLVEVGGQWVIQGPIKPLNDLLAGAPRKLHRPLHSDS